MHDCRRGSIAGGLLVAVLAAAPLSGQTVLVGADNTNNCIPFSCGASYSFTDYQQVYAASAFGGLGGPVSISALSFFGETSFGTGTASGGLFTVHLSTTSRAVGSLSASLATNLGGNNALFGVFTLPTGALSQFTLTGSPFLYDPTGGNLLMDATLSGGTNGSLVMQADGSGSVTSRKDDGLNTGDNIGLVTRFTYSRAGATVTPEPATMTLMATGLAGMVGFARRRRRT